MPQFILDTTGRVQIDGAPFQGATLAWDNLDSFTQGYIEALFFTDEEQLCEESGRDMPAVAFDLATMESRFVGGNSPGFADLAPDTLARIVTDCKAFQETNAALLAAASELVPGSPVFRYARNALDDRRLGQLFWYARNGHGVTFTDDGDAQCLDQLQKACGWQTPFPQVDSYVGDDGLIYLS